PTPPTTPLPTLSLHDALPISDHLGIDLEETPLLFAAQVACERAGAEADDRNPFEAVLEPVVGAACRRDPFGQRAARIVVALRLGDRKSTRLNSSHVSISYAVF